MTLFCTDASLKVLSTIVFDVEVKDIATKLFQLHTIADPNSGITVMFSQKKPLQWKEINTHISIISIIIMLFKKSPLF